jgi:hypothetical protein
MKGNSNKRRKKEGEQGAKGIRMKEVKKKEGKNKESKKQREEVRRNG